MNELHQALLKSEGFINLSRIEIALNSQERDAGISALSRTPDRWHHF